MTNNRTWFTAAAGTDGKTADIAIYDEIGGWGVTPSDFRDALDALGPVDTINLRLNSGGGDVFDGLTIHNMLVRHPAKVNVTIDGVAASIASLIAMAGDQITMPENAFMFVHNPVAGVIGDAAYLAVMSDALTKFGLGMASTYARKTGMEPEAVLAIMDSNTWMTAQEAKDKGFADVVAPPAKISARFDLRRFSPPASINAAYDPDGDGDDDALDAIGYIGSAIDCLTDAIGCLTGTGDPDDEMDTGNPMGPMMARLRRARAKMRQIHAAAAESWTVGAARDLPIDEQDAWDGPAAAARMLDAASSGEGADAKIDATARRGFLVYDATAPNLRGSYKLPFADLVGGDLKAMAGGLRAAAQRLPQTDIPDNVRTRAQSVLDAYSRRRDQTIPAASVDHDRIDEQIQIAAVCKLNGFPELTAEYLQSGKPLAAVTSELQARKADLGRGPGPDISARHSPGAGIDATAANWGRTLERLNRRVGR